MVFFTAGIDIGASTAKAVILGREAEILGQAVLRSGVDFSAAAREVLARALAQAGVSQDRLEMILATGYGRSNVALADQTRTEITCHAKGCYHYFPEALTIIDIGGQDNKVIKLALDGSRLSFKMNRKCAAGTGAFLEEMAARLDLEIGRMNQMAAEAAETVELGSYCTVFSATEVLEKIRQGKSPAGIVRGIFWSMVKRVMEMDSLDQQVV
ncbi:MAG: ATPase, partial [Deltaproteobacteria bacterium]|nr:ATPase [Deltaproteobacteria bacterium]